MINKTIQGIYGIINNMKDTDIKNTFIVGEINRINKFSYFKDTDDKYSCISETILLDEGFRSKIGYYTTYSYDLDKIPNEKRVNNDKRPYSFFSDEYSKEYNKILLKLAVEEENMYNINTFESASKDKPLRLDNIEILLNLDGFRVVNHTTGSNVFFDFRTYGSCSMCHTNSKKMPDRHIVMNNVVFNIYEPFIIERMVEYIKKGIFNDKIVYLYDILDTYGKESGFHILMEALIVSYFVRSKEPKFQNTHFNELSENSLSIDVDGKNIGTIEINKNSIHLYHNTPSKCLYMEFEKPTKSLVEDFSNRICTYLGFTYRNIKYLITEVYNEMYPDQLDYKNDSLEAKWYINRKENGEFKYKLIKENNKFYL